MHIAANDQGRVQFRDSAGGELHTVEFHHFVSHIVGSVDAELPVRTDLIVVADVSGDGLRVVQSCCREEVDDFRVTRGGYGVWPQRRDCGVSPQRSESVDGA